MASGLRGHIAIFLAYQMPLSACASGVQNGSSGMHASMQTSSSVRIGYASRVIISRDLIEVSCQI